MAAFEGHSAAANGSGALAGTGQWEARAFRWRRGGIDFFRLNSRAPVFGLFGGKRGGGTFLENDAVIFWGKLVPVRIFKRTKT